MDIYYIDDSIFDELDDNYDVEVYLVKPRSKRINRRKAERREFARAKRLNENSNRYRTGPWISEWGSEYAHGESKPIGKYLVYAHDSDTQRFAKHISNKKVRRSVDIPMKGNGYRRAFDYKWSVW